MSQRLVIISPCRDEEKYLYLTLNSVINQTRRPDRWIIVDDGSADATPEILARHAAAHPWIEVVRREPQGQRQLGPGVVNAVRAGLAHLGDDPYDFIAKLDCDLEFTPNCLAAILAHFDDPRVGMASGTVYFRINAKLYPLRYARFHIPGAAKFYRRACFADIGGWQSIYGWDILDETDARRCGWKTISDPAITIITPRMEGETLGLLKGRVIWGRGAYAIGGHPLFALARAVFRMTERPFLIGGLAFLWGFFSSYFHPGIKRTANQEFIRFLRHEQLYRIFHANRLPPAGD